MLLLIEQLLTTKQALKSNIYTKSCMHASLVFLIIILFLFGFLFFHDSYMGEKNYILKVFFSGVKSLMFHKWQQIYRIRVNALG